MKMSPTAETTTYSSTIRKTFSAQQLGSVNNTFQGSRKLHHGSMAAMNGLINSENKSKFDFFYKEPCFYSHEVYLKAAKIFSSLRHDTKEEKEQPFLFKKTSNDSQCDLDERIQYSDDNEKRLTFELAFETLKYQSLYDEILFDCAFFAHYPEFEFSQKWLREPVHAVMISASHKATMVDILFYTDNKSYPLPKQLREDYGLVLVIFSDYQKRKFQQRTQLQEEVLDSAVQSVEEAIIESKVKLNASLARHRIKKCALSIDSFLPETVRNKEEVSSKLPVYLWVNLVKTSVSEIVEKFKDEGYTYGGDDTLPEGNGFCLDSQCSDVLVFPCDSREHIIQHELYSNGSIVMQDKSSCLSPYSVKQLISDGDEILHVNIGSGLTAIHLASLVNQNNCNVLAFGPQDHSDFTEVQNRIEKYGVQNLKILKESFLDLSADDARLKSVKVVMITAECSKSGITSPVDFIVTEGEDMSILRDLSVGETDTSKLGELMAKHGSLLKRALSLPRVHAVVYSTKSIYDAENETVVTKAIEYINSVQQKKFPYRVVPPVLPFSADDIDNRNGISGKYVSFRASDKMSGCFVAVITREPEEAKDSAKDVIARAAAKGLLGGSKKEKKHDAGERGEEEDDEEGNGEVKLLRKRSKRSPRRIKGAVSVPAYHKPGGASVVQSYLRNGKRHHKSSAAIGQRLFQTKTINAVSKIDNKLTRPTMSEHLKVVKHPAPFSFLKIMKQLLLLLSGA